MTLFGPVGPAAARFKKSTTSGTSIAQTDAFEQRISVTPGTAVQPGTATLTTTGSNRTLAIDLGRVPDSRTFTDVVRLTNNATTAQTVDLSVLVGLPSIIGLEYSDGTTSKSLAPATTYQLRVRTNAAYAGLQTDNVRFVNSLASNFLMLSQPMTTRQAPLPPGSPTAVRAAPPGPEIDVGWAGSTSTNVSGYNVYRATAAGGPFSKINASAVTGTTYGDTSVAAGQRYWYKIRAIAAGVSPELESVDSAVVNARYAPTPTAVRVPAGGSNPANYVNNATKAAVIGQVDVPASSVVGDVVNIKYTSGATSVTRTYALVAAGAQTVNITGANLTGLADGPITLSAWMTDSGADGNSVAGTATKDTVVAVSASRIAATANNPVNYINIATGVTPGTATAGVDVPASSMATDTVSVRLTSGASTVTGTAAGLAGAGTVSVAGLNTNGWAQGAVTVEARVQDVAGNDTGWVAGTAATRDTVAPTAPTAARINATAVNPADTINIATQAAAGVTVTTSAGAASVQARLTVGATSVYGTLTGSGTIVVPVNATTLADVGAGGVQVSARQYDLAGNPSTWFVGTAALKDTVAPNPPNFARITFTNISPGNDRIRGANGALGAFDEVLIHDYADGASYPTTGYDISNGSGNFGRDNIAASVVPRTIGYDIRDSAWNPIARICRYYTANGTGSAVACP